MDASLRSPPATEGPSSPVGLTPRLLKGVQADYVPAPAYAGHNPSGLKPLGPNVVVRVDTCSDTTSGGVLLPDDQIERMDMASETGVIYAIGNTAWAGYGADERPKLGDRVAFQRYSGLTPRGLDGEKYRVMDDSCIACVLQDDPSPAR